MDTTILFFGGNTILRLPPLIYSLQSTVEIPKNEDLVGTKLFGYQQLQVTHIFVTDINFSIKIPYIILVDNISSPQLIKLGGYQSIWLPATSLDEYQASPSFIP